MKRKFQCFVLAVCLLCLSSLELEAADGLYSAPPPPGAAFIRVIHADFAPMPSMWVDGKKLTSLPSPGSISPYFALKHGSVVIQAGQEKQDLNLESEAYYSVVHVRGGFRFLADPELKNKMKTQISFFNMSSLENLSLKTKDGKITVISDVAKGQEGAREVNPIKIGFSIYQGKEKKAETIDLSLERGARYAVVVRQNAHGEISVSAGKSSMP